MKDKVIKDATSSIKNIIRHVYDQELEDGLNAGLQDSIIINKDVYGQGYEKGSQDAWECARKIYNDLSMDKCIEIFEGKSWFKYTASEAIAKIKEYEEKQAKDIEIKVGDEVIYCGGGAHDGSVGVVIGAEKDWREVRFKSSWNCVGVHKDSLNRTGRNFPQIAEVLEQMKGEEE